MLKYYISVLYLEYKVPNLGSLAQDKCIVIIFDNRSVKPWHQQVHVPSEGTRQGSFLASPNLWGFPDFWQHNSNLYMNFPCVIIHICVQSFPFL